MFGVNLNNQFGRVAKDTGIKKCHQRYIKEALHKNL
jgi:hypothetical protein